MAKRVIKGSDKKREEIERLRKRLRELEGDSEDYTEEKPVSRKRKNKYVRLLVILIIILLVVDVISVIAYYKPDFSNMIKFNTPGSSANKSDKSVNSNAKCSDGTTNDSCSKNKPFYCYNGQLLKKAASCGCPNGYKQDFQSCVKA